MPDPEPKDIEWPIGPGLALKGFGAKLTDYEKSEILEFKQIWYLG